MQRRGGGRDIQEHEGCMVGVINSVLHIKYKQTLLRRILTNALQIFYKHNFNLMLQTTQMTSKIAHWDCLLYLPVSQHIVAKTIKNE
jgi:hypothetical protein